MTGRVSVVIVCFALLLAACTSKTNGTGSRPGHNGTHAGSGGSTPAGTSAAAVHKPIDPCGLLTKDEVDHAAGTKTGAAVRSRDTCMYPTPTAAKFGQLNIYVGLGAKKIYDIDRKVLKHHFVSISGIGDEAHLEEGEIFFRVAKTWIAMQLARLDSVAKGPLLEQIARAAVRRL